MNNSANEFNGIATIAARPSDIPEQQWNHTIWSDAVDYITEGRVAWADLIQAENIKLVCANFSTSALREALAKLTVVRDEVVAFHRSQDRTGWSRGMCERDDRDISFLLHYPLV